MRALKQVLVLWAILSSAVAAQDWDGTLSVEMLAHPTLRKPIVGNPTTQLQWLPDGSLQETRIDRRRGALELLRVDPATFESKPLLDASKVSAALTGAGAPAAAVSAALASGAFVWNDRGSMFAITIEDDLWAVDVGTGKGVRLTKTEGTEEEVGFSPDSSRVAFVRANDLWTTSVADGTEVRLTTDGSPSIFNGKLDWVYQEELYGRGNWRGWWWAPDSISIGYLRLDETQVPLFTLLDHRAKHQEAVSAKYPKVGDPNPVAKLGIVPAAGGPTVWVKNPKDDPEALISNVGWSPDGRLFAQWQDRGQTWLELVAHDKEGGSRTVLRETTKAWVERQEMPLWMKDGSFLWMSDRTGTRHVYRYGADGAPMNAVTEGDFDVTEVHGLAASGDALHFSCKARSLRDLDVCRVGLDGKGFVRLTQEEGQHMQVRWSPDGKWFLEYWSDIHTPMRQHLRDASGAIVKVIDANPSPMWSKVKKGAVSFQQVPTKDGFNMETMLILPPDHDPSKKYPVMLFLYGGPGIPSIRNAFSRDLLFWHFLAQKGYVVWACDNRSASGRGWGAAWGVWKNFGQQELSDQLDALEWLKRKPWVDGSRIGIHGWSYGGYMTLYAMTHSEAFKCGVSGAPVTDWMLYDSIYTERYMGLSETNARGYGKSSPMSRVRNLSGKLLLIHGSMDDNVHPQHSYQFLDVAQQAGVPVEFLLLPGCDHSPRTPGHRYAVYKAMWDFISRNL